MTLFDGRLTVEGHQGLWRVSRERSKADLARAVGLLLILADADLAHRGLDARITRRAVIGHRGIRPSYPHQSRFCARGNADSLPGRSPRTGGFLVSAIDQVPAVGPHSVTIAANRQP